jgi:hypothetical protein
MEERYEYIYGGIWKWISSIKVTKYMVAPTKIVFGRAPGL